MTGVGRSTGYAEELFCARNIKHAFFQPADKELLTLVHFRLRNPIMVGKKKTEDVQFYTEVGEAVQTLDGGRRSMYDPDEIEEEQRERDVRNKVGQKPVCCGRPTFGLHAVHAMGQVKSAFTIT